MKISWRRARNFTISIGYWVGWSVYRCIRLCFEPRPPGRCMALCYHTIAPGERDAFRRQMEELTRIATPVRPDLRQGVPSRKPAVAITFDDAYASVVENIVPELAARGIPCAVFVPTGYLGQRPGWKIWPGAPERFERVVCAERLRGLPWDLVVLGSHSVSHGDASRQDAKTVLREFRDSRLHLERIAGRKITLLALPYGSASPEALDLARRTGYLRVFSGGPRLSRMTRTDFLVGRVRVDPTDSLFEFRLKVLGAYCWLPALSRMKRMFYALLGRMSSEKRKPRVDAAKTPYAVKADAVEP